MNREEFGRRMDEEEEKRKAKKEKKDRDYPISVIKVNSSMFIDFTEKEKK